MARLFNAYVMVDWSAANKPTTGKNSIWIGVLKRNVRLQLVFESHNPSTRAAAEKQIATILDDLIRRGDRILLGFDFPLGFPHGTAAALKQPDAPYWKAMHALIAKEIKDKADNTSNRFPVAASLNFRISGGPFPFWGCTERDALNTLTPTKSRAHGEGDLPEFRHADREAKGASPVWKLSFPGSVGSQALLGIPVVKRLKEARGDALRMWPFETGWKRLTPEDLDGVEIVCAEIYPSLALKPGAAGDEIPDLAQVRAIAEYYAARDEKGQLAALFGPKAADDPRLKDVTREEGWILGV